MTTENILYSCKTSYHDIFIIERDNVRILKFGSGKYSEQSAMNINYPFFHVFDYSLLAMYAFSFINNPHHILIIGLGGATIPKEIYRFFPNINMDIIEIDPAIPEIAEKYFNFQKNSNTTIHIGDATTVIDKIRKRYDMIIIDAFFSDYIPKNLTKISFIKKIKNIMSEKSIATWNISNIDYSYFYYLKDVIEVFGSDVYKAHGPRNPFSITVYMANNSVPFKIFFPQYPTITIDKIKKTSIIK